MKEKIKKRLKMRISCVVVAGLCIWVSNRWDTWFGNKPEPAYVTQPAPHRVLLTMGNNGERSRIITWQADTVAQPRQLSLFYTTAAGNDTLENIDAACDIVRSRSGEVAFYRAELNNIPQNASQLRYKIKTGDKESGFYSFCMPDADAKNEFLFMADVQDSAHGLSHDYFAAIDQRHPNARFWLFGGDLAERPMDCWWKVVFSDLDSIATRKPILSISGNHEYLKGMVKELDPRVGKTFGYYQKSKVGANHVFTFAQGDARFFLLDSNVDFWNLPAQRNWLKESLANCTEKWKIVVLHHPLYSNKGKRYNPMVKAAFGGIVKDYGVDLVLQGHEHVYARWNDKDEQGNYLAPVYLSSMCSPKQYQLHFSVEEDRLGTNDRFYQHIGYNADSLVVWTYTMSDMKPYDHLCITKNDGEGYKVTDFYRDQPQKIEVSEWFRKNKGRHVKEYEEEIVRFQRIEQDKR